MYYEEDENKEIYENEEIDEEWIKEFDEIDKNYKNLYLDDLSFILLNCIYVNNNNEIVQIKKEKIILDEMKKNFITKQKLFKILKNYNNKDGITYNISSIIKYNIDLKPENINHFIMDTDDNNYIQIMKEIDDIYWNKTIKMFEDLNNLIIIFYQNNNIIYKKDRDTKKILFLRNNNPTKNNKTMKKHLK